MSAHKVTVIIRVSDETKEILHESEQSQIFDYGAVIGHSVDRELLFDNFTKALGNTVALAVKDITEEVKNG